jgi:phosphoglucomutase
VLSVDTTYEHDYVGPYVEDLNAIVNMPAISAAGLKIGVDPMGGSGVAFWAPMADRYGLNLEVVNRTVDPSIALSIPPSRL